MTTHLFRFRFSSTISLALILSLSLLTACGGGGSSSGGGGGGGTRTVSITASPASTTIVVSQSVTLTAVVANSSNTSVTWAVTESSGGTVSASGVYTAPSVPGTYHVTATSQADATKSVTITITVTAATPSFTSTAPTSASQGTLLTYNVTATDPTGGSVTFALTAAPTGATLTGNTLTWTPTSAQARTPNSFTIQATSTSGGTANQTFSITPTGTVSGTRVFNFHTTDPAGAFGSVNINDDTSVFTISALVPNGSGAFTTIAGSGSATGSYTIPNVPGGYFWLQHGINFFWTQSSTIDSGYDWNGRPALTGGAPGTTLDMSMTGGSSWQTNDMGYLYAPNIGRHSAFSSSAGSTTPSASFSFAAPSPLMDSSQGDSVYISQMVDHSTISGHYLAVEHFYGPQGFTTVSGVSNPLSAAFTSVTANSTFRGNIKGSQFNAFLGSMGTGVTTDWTCAGLYALPSAASTGFTGYYGGDVVLSSDCATGVANLTDVDLGDISYGNPYPSNWPLFVQFVQSVHVSYQLAGTGAAYNASGSNVVYSTTMPTSTQGIAPVIGPVQSPTIAASAGASTTNLLSGATGVGTTPVIRWGAPTVGTPTAYLVYIAKLANFGGTTGLSSYSTLYVPGTVRSIQVPPGVMTTGQTYFIRISARVNGTVNVEQAPYRTAFPYGNADVFSGLVTP